MNSGAKTAPRMAPPPLVPPLVAWATALHVLGCCCCLQARDKTKSLIWHCQEIDLVRRRCSSSAIAADFVALPEVHRGTVQRLSTF